MCSFTLSNPDTVTGLSGQLPSKKALSFKRAASAGLLLSMFLENFTKNWKCAHALRRASAAGVAGYLREGDARRRISEWARS